MLVFPRGSRKDRGNARVHPHDQWFRNCCGVVKATKRVVWQSVGWHMCESLTIVTWSSVRHSEIGSSWICLISVSVVWQCCVDFWRCMQATARTNDCSKAYVGVPIRRSLFFISSCYLKAFLQEKKFF